MSNVLCQINLHYNKMDEFENRVKVFFNALGLERLPLGKLRGVCCVSFLHCIRTIKNFVISLNLVMKMALNWNLTNPLKKVFLPNLCYSSAPQSALLYLNTSGTPTPETQTHTQRPCDWIVTVTLFSLVQNKIFVSYITQLTLRFLMYRQQILF